MRASKQLLVYINILNMPLVKHWGYRIITLLISYWLPCFYLFPFRVDIYFSYGFVYALGFMDHYVKVKPDMCFPLLRILFPMLQLLTKYIISKCRKKKGH